MKQLFTTYRAVALMLVAILLLSVGLTVLTGGFSFGSEQADGKTVLATTYPIYVAARQILGDDDTVTLIRLQGAASGCLHDYQLSPSDRRAVQEADLILMNGAGAETFLHGIVDEAKCVDTSQGLALLCSAHDHDHADSAHHHEEEYNEHLWLSPTLYSDQVIAVRNALCRINPDGEDRYYTNTMDYVLAIEDLRVRLDQAKAVLEGRPCVLFHDSMAYLADYMGLDVKLTLSVEGESGLSAADLKKVEALAAETPDLLLLYDSQYALRYDGVAGIPLTLNTAVQGPNDWIEAMEYNVALFTEIAKGGGAP